MSIVLFNTIILFTSIILIGYLTIIIDGYRLESEEFNLCNPQLDPQSFVDHIGEYINKETGSFNKFLTEIKLNNFYCAHKIIAVIDRYAAQFNAKVMKLDANSKLYNAISTINRILDKCVVVRRKLEKKFKIQGDIDDYCKDEFRPLKALHLFSIEVDLVLKQLIEGVNYKENKYLIVAIDAFNRSQQCADVELMCIDHKTLDVNDNDKREQIKNEQKLEIDLYINEINNRIEDNRMYLRQDYQIGAREYIIEMVNEAKINRQTHSTLVKDISIAMQNEYFYRHWAIVIVAKQQISSDTDHSRLKAINKLDYYYIGNNRSLIDIDLDYHYVLLAYSIDKTTEYKNCPFQLNATTHYYSKHFDCEVYICLTNVYFKVIEQKVHRTSNDTDSVNENWLLVEYRQRSLKYNVSSAFTKQNITMHRAFSRSHTKQFFVINACTINTLKVNVN